MNRRRVAATVIFLLLAAAGAGWWWRTTRMPPPVEWQGYAEADFIKVGPTQQGLLMSLYVARGSKVAAGAPLFDQDDTNDRAAHDQAARQLKQAKEQLANLQAGGKPTEIQQAEANLADAYAARDKLQSDLKRNEELVKTGGVSRQLVEDQRADLRSALARVQGLEAAVAQLHAPMGREGEIKAQQQLVESLRAAAGMAQWRIDQRHVMAPAAGVVADVLARPGETIPAGGPVVSLLPPENIFVRFFVPEQRLAEVHIGDKVALVCDRCPADFAATVSFISPQAEFTPPVIYSEASRAKLVYMVEARPPRDQAALINPGQPTVVRPLPAPPIARNTPESAFR
jgi:HlyD family secretion protein